MVNKQLTLIGKAADDAVQKLAVAADKATSAISSAALDAAKLIASNAAEALKVTNTMNDGKTSDHDILTEFRAETRVQMDNISKAIQNLSDGTSKRIDTLEQEKLNIKDSYPALYKAENDRINSDHENRTRLLETNLTRVMTWGSVGIVAIGIIEFLVSRFIK